MVTEGDWSTTGQQTGQPRTDSYSLENILDRILGQNLQSVTCTVKPVLSDHCFCEGNFERYDTYLDTHEVIFHMYQQYILSGFRQKKHDISTNFTGIWEF